MSSYTIKPGDTFERIARQVYGDDLKAYLIRDSNPGADGTLVVGETLIIPSDTSATPSEAKSFNSDAVNEVALQINGVRFRHWDTVTITRAIDTVSVVEFTAPFDPNDRTTRDAFKPFKFQDVTIDVGGSRLFSGTMMTPSPSVTPTDRTLSVSCYGKPGVLGDCTAPASSYPIEWDQATLKTIAEAAAKTLGIAVQFDADPGAAFPREALNPGEKVLDFLSSLAAQRNLVIGDTPDGKLFFPLIVESGSPRADFTEGEAGPMTEVSPQFSPQEYYSHVTGIAPLILGLAGTQFTVKNAKLADAVRPVTFDSKDMIDSDVAASVNSKAGRMFASAISYELTLSTWRDPSGEMWEPNTLVTLLAPGAFVYSRSTFLIRSVTLSKTDTSEQATLSLIIPGTLAGKVPERLPWDD